jgi:hypothetical protein
MNKITLEETKKISYEAFVYAYPMLQQIKTINGMMKFMGLTFNEPVFNTGLPWETVGQPIVCPNLTSMSGGILVGTTYGPVTIEIPEVKDRYIVYQCIDAFTHNTYYMGTRANNGDGGRFTFYNKGQQLPDLNATPIELESNHAIIAIRIDIADASEKELLQSIEDEIKVIDAPTKHNEYPPYDKEKAFSPDFVELINDLLTEIPESETALFERFARIGIFSDVTLTKEERKEVQAGIDAAFADIKTQSKTATALGNGWVGATTVFGNRQFLNKNYMGRAIGAHFGLWGNSKAEANYFLGYFEGEGELVFKKEDLPPLKDIGFWSITAHDGEFYVKANEYDSYVLTMDKMEFDEDGGITFKFSSKPESGNWLYTPGGGLGVLLRAYQADTTKIEGYVPPQFINR